jgi:4-amino-4-deoxy-L-arabinose transferase-like glycosyltransferase
MNKRNTWLLVIILGISVMLRLAAALYLGDEVDPLPGTGDQINYNYLAQRVLAGHGFTFDHYWWPATPAGEPTAHWSYLYTFYLMGVYALLGLNPLAARLIQALLVGILHPLLAYLLGKRLFHPAAGLLAAGFTAVYTYFIYYSVTLMTEPFFITTVLLSLYLSTLLVDRLRQNVASSQDSTSQQNRRVYADEITLAMGLGLSLAAAVLLRQLYLLFIPFLFLWIGWLIPRVKLHLILIPLGVIAAAILPFTVFNYLRFDTFVLLNTNAGFALFWSNHPIYATHYESLLSPGIYQQLIPPELRHLNEAFLDKALLGLGIGFILDDPARILSLSISRIPALFQFWPSPESSFISNFSRVTSFGLLLPLMLAGFLAASYQTLKSDCRFCRHHLFLISAFILFYILLHLLSWSLIRYRLPVDALLVIFAGYASVELFNRIRHRRLSLDAARSTAGS